MAEPGRAVLIRYQRDGRPRRGSGVRVGGRFVLTANHCVDGSGHVVIVDGVEYPATVHVRSQSSDVDLAVLVAGDVVDPVGLTRRYPELGYLVCGVVDRGVDTDIESCRALGYPTWKPDYALARVRGVVPTAEGLTAYGRSVPMLSLKLTDPAVREPVPSGSLEEPTSVWAGFSGAGVVTADDILFGVVRSHTLSEGGQSLTVTPLQAIDTLEIAEVRELFWAALGVDGARRLIDVSQRGLGTPQVVVGAIPAQPQAFVDRDSVDRLSRAMDAGQAAVVCAVTGQRGVGKTQVAAAYARRRVEQGWPLVAWVNADTADGLIGELAAVAAALGVHDLEGGSTKSARRLREHLSIRTGPGLVVFDNAADPDRLREFLPATGATQVVITSTDQAFTEFGVPVPVDSYDRSESIRYLTQRTGLDASSGADEVADALGDLPLALAQAASTIGRRRWTYQTYLNLLDDAPVDRLLPRLPGQDYPHSTAAALLLSITTLQTDDPTSATTNLLSLVAALSADGISRSILNPLDERLQPDVDELLERCVGASVLTWSVDGKSVLMHRLVGRVIRDRCKQAGLWNDAVAGAVDLLAPQVVPPESAWRERDRAADLLPQVVALHMHATASGEALDQPTVARALELAGWAVRHLVEVADLTRAINLGTIFIGDIQRVLGPDHPVTLISRNNLANAYQSAGRLEQAIEIYEQTLTDSQRVLGPDHPVTLSSRNNLASAYESAGRLDRAIEMHEQALTDAERVLGPDHPNTLGSRNNLASAYRSAGQFDPAIEMYEQALNDTERVLGPNHSITLTSRNNLAYAYQLAGRLDQAIELHEQAFTDTERVLGPDHPDTLGSRNNLASAYQSAGRLDEAIDLYEKVLTDLQRVLSPDHPHTLTSRNNLASAYQSAGRLEQAIELYEQTLTDLHRSLGPNHPDTLASRNNLAGVYQSAGRLDQVIEMHERALTDTERVLGPDHRDTLAVRNDLAGAYQSAGRLDQAIDLFEQTLNDRERVLGPNHPDTLAGRNNLAGAYQSAGRLDQAIDLYEKVLTDLPRVLSPDHPATLISRNNLAGAYLSAGRLDRAIELYEQIFNDTERILGPNHPDTLSSWNNLDAAKLSDGR